MVENLSRLNLTSLSLSQDLAGKAFLLGIKHLSISRPYQLSFSIKDLMWGREMREEGKVEKSLAGRK